MVGVASVPGASAERLHASLGLLSLAQMEHLLMSMVERGMIIRQIPDRNIGCSGLFSGEEAPSTRAVYFAY